MPNRRQFLQAGGLALAGLALPTSLFDLDRANAGGQPGRSSGTVTIRMRSDDRGARVWFDPVGVRVPPGATIRWLLDANVHSATAYHPANGYAPRIPPDAPPWDSGLMTVPGQAFAVQLDVPGMYDYFCAPHELAGMAGRIVVAARGTRASEVVVPGPPPEGLRAASAASLAVLPDIARILREGAVTIANA
ncbi:MAG TPA: plastocyanin/azurin family copper-binding protein [Gemmatimonadota bacterium]|nr:plastocyanin/azurin family copper-binding protein [Gemmatimonadota bacterium]